MHLSKVSTSQCLRHGCIIFIYQNNHLSVGKLMHEFGQFLEGLGPLKMSKVTVQQVFKKLLLAAGEIRARLEKSALLQIFGNCHIFIFKSLDEVIVGTKANILHAIADWCLNSKQWSGIPKGPNKSQDSG